MINFVNVGPDGTFERSGSRATASRNVDELFSTLRTGNATSLAMHFHGGLVSESVGISIAEKMAPVYQAAGSVPLTFVWETGLMETLRDNLRTIHETVLYQKLLRWLLRRAAQRFGGINGRGAGVLVPMKLIDDELAQPRPFAALDNLFETGNAMARGGVQVDESGLDTLEPELEVEFQEDVDGDEIVVSQVDALVGNTPDSRARGVIEGIKLAKMLAAIAFRVIRRHVRGRDHGFYPTVVEELLRELYLADLGAWIWGRMKEKAAMMWRSNIARVGDERRVGTYVLEKIAELQAARPEFSVDLIGHSAGSIAICELLRALAERDVPVRVNTIAFLAPAGRSELGLAELARHPERFNEFRCYTMADEFESEDALLSGVYTRSLLYFISGVLEPDEVDAPIMGMMRHATGRGPFASGAAAEWTAFMTAHRRLVLSDSAVLDPDAIVGRRSSSRSHGGFDDDGPTRESLTALLRA